MDHRMAERGIDNYIVNPKPYTLNSDIFIVSYKGSMEETAAHSCPCSRVARCAPRVFLRATGEGGHCFSRACELRTTRFAVAR
jgi:hypothetical protein